MEPKFEWDLIKEKSNIRKHHVSFETATRVFADPFAVVEQNRIENGEHRWRTLGLVDDFGVLLVVAHTVSLNEDGTEVIRIISARRAGRKEKQRYEENCPLRG